MEKTVEILKALSDRNRLRIIMALTRYDELCACQITEFLSVTGATASRHLSILQHAEWLKSRKEGRWHYFRLNRQHPFEPLLEWLKITTSSSDEIAADVDALESILAIEREDLCRIQRGENCCPNLSNLTKETT